MSDWLAEQLQFVQSLEGQIITEWYGDEMALNEPSIAADLIWHHPSIPVLQFLALYGRTPDRSLRFSTYQNDLEWGLYVNGGDGERLAEQMGPVLRDPQGSPSIYRRRTVPELPIGQIVNVSVRRDRQNNLASFAQHPPLVNFPWLPEPTRQRHRHPHEPDG